MPLSQNMSMTELSRFRTRICERKALHGVCELDERCPFSHCLSWHRRNPYEYAYRPNLCPNVVFQNENKKMRVKNYCQRGRMCMFSHTKEEQMYHVLVYKTQLCREYPLCTKHYCPFAHGLDELRNPETIEFDPVQGPEVIERQRLVHDCNKFNEIDLSEDLNDSIIIRNKEAIISNVTTSPISPSNSPLHSNMAASSLAPVMDQTKSQNSKYSLRNKSQISASSTNNSPKKGGRGSGLNHNKANSNSQNRQFTNNELLKGELTPINNTNESPVTPSTGCETPLHSQNHIASTGFKNDARKTVNRDFQRKEVDRARGASPNTRSAFPKVIDGDEVAHARDNVNIPPPPYNAIGLNFPCNEGLNDNTDPSSLLPNYDFGRFAWNGYFDRNKNLLNNRLIDYEKNKMVQEPLCSIDDYGNGASVEQMSYLMHLQLLSLSDSPEKLLETMNNNDSDWSLSNPAFGITGIYNTQQNRDSNACNSQCNFSTELNSNPIPSTSHQDAIRCQNEVKITPNSQLFLSNNYFDDYRFDFINDNVPNHDKMGLRDINNLYNRSDINLKIDCTDNSWNLFHPSLLGSSTRDGDFWTEGK
ncbi:Zinc finger C3H1-type domain containing protein [Cryptosporidium hominis]|uniref:Zinc finger C3H1-type domain containing protein n=1 Tax=Cryptosporidium hominis TaxID=237895 RepID=A0ABX5BGT9_CRYHO|nr:Zinc finger C3H1-type domain containing protein [Cryptosporidium hominis]|eukprot:PPS97652.1 Zinc finger C3H1-type domain containing protein [Cryptosporidium hominis]